MSRAWSVVRPSWRARRNAERETSLKFASNSRRSSTLRSCRPTSTDAAGTIRLLDRTMRWKVTPEGTEKPVDVRLGVLPTDRGAEPAVGQVADDHAGRFRSLDQLDRIARDPKRDERALAGLGPDLESGRQQ